MDRTYILCDIYTSENSAKHRNTQLSEMYPDVAGTEEAVEKDPEDQELILKVSKCKTIV